MSRLRLAILPVPSKEAPSLQAPVHLTWVVQERFPVWLSCFGDSRNMRVPQGTFLSAVLLAELHRVRVFMEGPRALGTGPGTHQLLSQHLLNEGLKNSRGEMHSGSFKNLLV